MKNKIIRLLEDGVEKPSRYVGGEYNSVIPSGDEFQKFCFCFPDSYEVGMSHLGMKLLYGLINQKDDCVCERCYAPWPDMEKKMREEGIPLYSLESFMPLCDFDIVGFTLQYEMSYTNILNMLDLAGIPLRSKDRGENYPIIIAGGPCGINPEPLANFFDLFLIGDGEESLVELLDLHEKCKRENINKTEMLKLAATQIEGCYVPSLYEISYADDGSVSSFITLNNAPKTITRRIVKDLDSAYFPTKLVIPFSASVHDRIMLELFRGCTRGCRFCQAGYIYRPVRERSLEKLVEIAESTIAQTGYEELSLMSLSTGDYSNLVELVERLSPLCHEKRISMQLPSLRVDSFSEEVAKKLTSGRKGTLTFAPEAGSQRLRDVINKGICEEDILESAARSFANGWSKVKLYFMIGLPSETYEDLDGIIDLARKVGKVYYDTPADVRNKGLRINISTSTFVPKPCTPFQWCAQDSLEDIRKKQIYLKNGLKGVRGVNYRYHDSSISMLEAAISKGDRRIGDVLEKAWQSGCKFDAWSEFFDNDKWLAAFEDVGISPSSYANVERGEKYVWPFEHIDSRVKKKYLFDEYKRSKTGEKQGDCRGECNACMDINSSVPYCEEMRGMKALSPGFLCGD